MSSSSDVLQAGLVVRLDTDALRSQGGCHTNAVVGPDGDRAVEGTHDFLILRVNSETAVCTAVPLFSKSAVGSQPLLEELKSGAEDGWIGTELFFSRWQHWRIPSALIGASLATDASAAGGLRRYAEEDASALDDIRAWEGRNRAEYRPA